MTHEQKQGTSFNYKDDCVYLDNKFYHIPASAYYTETYE